MPLDRADPVTTAKPQSPAWLFFKRWLASPLTMASITPSSQALARIIAGHVRREEDEVVVEYGGGTGSITRALLDSAIPPSRLFVAELDPELAGYLRGIYPDVTVIEGDVRRITELLPAQHVGKVGTVVVGIPMVLLPPDAQQQIVDGIFAIMPPGRHFLAYTYTTGSPINTKALGLRGRRVGFTLANVPPASVWAFTR